MSIEIDKNKIYTIKDLCVMFGVKESTVKRWIKTKGLKAKIVNYVHYVSGSNLAEFLGDI